MFPVEYGPQYDTALHVLLWELLSKLEKMLPVPDLKQVFIFISQIEIVIMFLHDDYIYFTFRLQPGSAQFLLPWMIVFNHHLKS